VTHSDGGHIIFSPGGKYPSGSIYKKTNFLLFYTLKGCVLFSILMLVTVKEDDDGAALWWR
jgi:hypothetical protein